MHSTSETFIPASRRSLPALVLAWLSALVLGCNAVPAEPEDAQIDNGKKPVDVDNGLTTNGLTTNGLTTNGLTTNGLTSNGLGTDDFARWFNGNANTDMAMRYMIRCALPAGTHLTWANPADSVSYTWSGESGLAPGWASGQTPSTLERQLVSACLAAHVNKYGVNVTISMLGRGPDGTPLSIGADELSAWSVREGCFFGDLTVAGGVVYTGSDRATGASESSNRACALSTQTPGSSTQCAPMVYVGACADYCTLDSTGTWYESCTYNGTTYRPLTTRVQPSDVYTCGDGVCQSLTEQCGTGTTPDSCGDCGPCSP